MELALQRPHCLQDPTATLLPRQSIPLIPSAALFGHQSPTTLALSVCLRPQPEHCDVCEIFFSSLQLEAGNSNKMITESTVIAATAYSEAFECQTCPVLCVHFSESLCCLMNITSQAHPFVLRGWFCLLCVYSSDAVLTVCLALF